MSFWERRLVMHIGHGQFFQNLDDRPDYDVWSTEMVLADRAEALVVESVWAVEHHCGTLDEVIEQTREIVRRTDAGGLLVVSAFGNLAREVVRANQARFARSVMPHCAKPLPIESEGR
jgi:hypothetical protein